MEERSSSVAVATPPAASGWPHHVQLILSALESGQHLPDERRAILRAPYRAKAQLRLFSHAKNAPAALLYTRDACTRGMGFITPHYLPLGHGGKVEVLMPDGNVSVAHCTLCRCRQVSPGWYEGALNFTREQMGFQSLVHDR